MIINDRDRRRIGRARLLRRAGHTYDEIRALIGPVGNDQLSSWFKGIPRPPETRRTHRLPETRLKCRQLRAQGLTYDEIAAITGASKGSISLWVRDVRLPARLQDQRTARQALGRVRAGQALHEVAERRRMARVDHGRRSVGALNDRELFLVGVALYWAEGSKSKPWRRARRVKIINSDPTVLRTFLAWLDLIGVPEAARSYRLSIHVTVGAGQHELWWARELGLSPDRFRSVTLKRHNPQPGRYNLGADYHGCLVIDVAKSTGLYDAIDGWWQAIHDSSRAAGCTQSLGCSEVLPGSSNGRTRSFGLRHGGSIPSPGAVSTQAGSGSAHVGSLPWQPTRWWDSIDGT